ncbi:MAG: PIG-L family deacetylase [Patescibacteria group bacterium]
MAAEKLRFTKNKSAIVVVAHPDDETIWMSGFILKHPQMSWTIFSLCRASDPDRAPKFLRVCKQYNARAIIEDLEDDGKLNLKQTLPIIKKLILQRIKNKKFDYIFTHGFNGEYGHPRHIGVYRVVSQLVKEQALKPKAVFYLNYTKKSRKKFAPLFAKKNSNLLLKLTNQKFAQKKKIMTDIYGFAPNNIDVNYCTNPEAFKIKLAAKQL